MSFQSSLRTGAIGETLFYQAHCGDLKRIDGMKGDFEFLHGPRMGEKLELKTDFYDLNKTPNFFFERWSDRDAKTPGGPWQSLQHGCRWFSYFFVSNFIHFDFETLKLVSVLETIIPTMKPVQVRNSGWITEGYRVPREMLVDIATPVELVVSKRVKVL